MKLECVITLANKVVELPFRALERSLRASGCTLPLYVIPYNDNRFELPKNSFWLEDKELFALLAENSSHPMMRKYACLTRANYLFVDTDVIFLKNPQRAYAPYEGFIANCTHWNNPHHTTSEESLRYFKSLSTTYQKNLFNAGQFASSMALYPDFDALKAACLTLPHTTLRFPYHDQPGLNYLVAYSRASFTNLTLPPHNFEGSWAGEYLDKSEVPSGEKSPFFLHYAGLPITGKNPIDNLFLGYLTSDERRIFLSQEKVRPQSFLTRLKILAKGTRDAFKNAFLKN